MGCIKGNKHNRVLIYFDFAVECWKKNYSQTRICDAIMQEYGMFIDTGHIGYLCRKYPDQFPKKTQQQINEAVRYTFDNNRRLRSSNRQIVQERTSARWA